MSMPRVPQGRAEVGETVASFPTYEAAQKAVSELIAGDVPARDIAIVGFGLRSIERVTGKLGYATAARTGAINGLLLGLFFSAIFLLGSSTVSVPVFIGVLFIGVALGMLMSIGAYAIVRRRRDFASVMQVVADHYDVTVLAGSIHRAREIVGNSSVPQRRVHPQPPAAVEPDASPAPPRYGERVEPAERTPSAEPPRYGERIVPADETPADEAPADAASTDETPADEAPAHAASTDEAPPADAAEDDDRRDDGDRPA
ncbi:general stress protein [Microbacterium sp.]|uniref:general stress protein n=1 Tax=Microbacterium sp. TaxID=51671 RepID=UPI003A932788